MAQYEYHVLPAPGRAEKVRGAKTPAERFAGTLTQIMNAMAAEGWEYVRADSLPCEEGKMFRGKTVSQYNLLVFRREIRVPQGDTTMIGGPLPRPQATVAMMSQPPSGPQLRAAWDDQDTTAPALGPARSR
jgi:hypothetical protein